MRLALTFEEFVELSLMPPAGADAAFRQAAELQREAMFPMTTAQAAGPLGAHGPLPSAAMAPKLWAAGFRPFPDAPDGEDACWSNCFWPRANWRFTLDGEAHAGAHRGLQRGLMSVSGWGLMVIELAGLELAAEHVGIPADRDATLRGIVGHAGDGRRRQARGGGHLGSGQGLGQPHDEVGLQVRPAGRRLGRGPASAG